MGESRRETERDNGASQAEEEILFFLSEIFDEKIKKSHHIRDGIGYGGE